MLFRSSSVQAADPSARVDPASLPKSRWRHWACAVVLTASMTSFHPVTAEIISSRRLVEVVDLSNLAISPDGRFVAFRTEQASIERNTYDTVWYVQQVEGDSPPVRVAEGGVPVRQPSTGTVPPSPAVWSPDGRWIYFRALLDGRMSVWRAAADGSGAQEVTIDPADVRAFSLSADGQTLSYSVGASRDAVEAAEQAEYDQGVRIDERIVLSAGLSRSSLVEGRPATQRFLGDWFSTGPLLAETPDRWKAVDLATMTTRDLPEAERPPSGPTAADIPPYLPKPTLLVQHPVDGRIALLGPAGGPGEGQLLNHVAELSVLETPSPHTPVRCRAALCTNQMITHIQWRPGGDELLFTVTEQERSQSIHAWNVRTGVVRPVVRAEGLVSGSQRYHDTNCSPSSTHLVCVAAEADRPPRLEAIDMETGERRPLFEPNERLEKDIAATAPAELIRWTDEQGRQFTGRLFEARVTPSASPPPLFVTFYNCYGFLRGGMGDEWPLTTLAEQGISTLCINAIPEFRTDFVGRHDQGRMAVESVVAYLSASGRIDPSRVGMGGLSYGSEVTLWTLMNSNVVTAASISTPSVTPSWYLFNRLREAFRTNAMTSWQLGAPDETPEQWRAISPGFHLDKIKAPILFQMPEREYLMALDYAVPLIQRRQAELYAFPEEAHIKFQPRHKLAVYERNLDWFRFWLQDYEDPDPRKANQYRRWREMRAARDAAAVSALPPAN